MVIQVKIIKNFFSILLFVGGDGAEGKKGRDATQSDLESVVENFITLTVFISKGLASVSTRKEEQNFMDYLEISTYELYGGKGYQGGDGGRAGCGGKNGYGRTIWLQKVDKFKEDISVNVQEKNFGLGENGVYGEGGSGGLTGDTAIGEHTLHKAGVGWGILTLGIAAALPNDRGWQYFSRQNYERSNRGSVRLGLNCASQAQPIGNDIQKAQVDDKKKEFELFLNEVAIRLKLKGSSRFLFF
jgi:hypothetical protein